MFRHSKERRRLIEVIHSLMRRAPLSTAQRDRLAIAIRELQRDHNWRTDAGERRIFTAVQAIASIALETTTADEKRN